MPKFRQAACLLAASMLLGQTRPSSAAQPVAPAAAADPTQALERFAVTIQRRTLKNGLRVVLVPEPTSPTIAVAVTYGVGSRHEPAGKSGFAHLFEHMMFE